MPTLDPTLTARLNQLVVRHSQFEAAYAAIDEVVREADLYADKSLLPLIGPSRAGKSRLLETYLDALYPQDLDAQAPRSVRHVTMPTSSSRPRRAALMKLQHALGHPFFAVGDEDAMLIRLVPMLQSLNVKVLLVDELQRCVSPRGQINYDVADLFTVLLDEAKVTIVAAGLENSANVLEANNQLTNRCLQAVRLPRFDWIDPPSRAEFMGLVDAFSESLAPLRLPGCDDEADYFRWFVACGGLVGHLHKIFRKLLVQLEQAKRMKVTLEDLDAAHRAAVYYRGAKLRPFARDFATEDEVTGLTYAARIGERLDPSDAPPPLNSLSPSRSKRGAARRQEAAA